MWCCCCTSAWVSHERTHVPSAWTSRSTGGHHDVPASDCAGCRAQAQGTRVSLWRVGSVAVAHALRFHVACGIPPAWRWNPCPLRWQADSQALYPQEAPTIYFQSWAPSVPVMINLFINHMYLFLHYCSTQDKTYTELETNW